ncbi:MAG: hypothetical protein HWN66_06080 [Candidatus Helarchaeota archaeon]|nr:hypothetical protein [Candidatus Helarchaeota archaeon]
MPKMNLEVKMEILHRRMNNHEEIKGSILLRDNGLHISSNIPPELPEGRKLSAYIANIWRHLYKINDLDEGIFRLKDGIQVYMKYIPSRKIILTTLSNNADDSSMKELMKNYSKLFQNIFQ